MKRKKINRVLISTLGILIMLMMVPTAGFADVPQTISHQGYLTNAAGDPVDTGGGTISIQFAIYDLPETAPTATQLWVETQDVIVNQGVYIVVLGADTGNPIMLTFDAQYYLGITVETDPETTPRTALTSVPYAFSSINADSVDGMHASEFITTEIDPVYSGSAAAEISLSQIIEWDKASVVIGEGTIASGANSMAMGNTTTASGANSIAMPLPAIQWPWVVAQLPATLLQRRWVMPQPPVATVQWLWVLSQPPVAIVQWPWVMAQPLRHIHLLC
jgi:hypothetical protein